MALKEWTVLAYLVADHSGASADETGPSLDQVAHLVQQSPGQLAQLRGCEVVELGFVDHENASCPL